MKCSGLEVPFDGMLQARSFVVLILLDGDLHAVLDIMEKFVVNNRDSRHCDAVCIKVAAESGGM